MKKRKYFLLIALMGTMVLLCACSKKSYSIEDFEKIVEDDASNFDKAIDIYKWLYENEQEEIKNTSQSMDKLFSNLYDNYSDEKLNREQVQSYLDKISKIDAKTATLISSINTKMNKLDESRTAYSEAEKYYEKGEYVLAIEKYEKVIIEDKNYQDAKNKIILSNEQILKSVVDKVNTLQAEEKFEEALKLLAENKSRFNNQDEYDDKYNQIVDEYANTYLVKANDFVTQHEYMEALELLDSFPINNNAIVQLKEKVTNEYVDAVIAEAKQTFSKDRDYKTAINILHKCEVASSLIDDEILKYQEYIPFELSQLKPIKINKIFIGQYSFSEYMMDVNKQIYSTVFCRSGELENGEEAYVSYYLNHEYNRITGTVFRPYGTLRMEDAPGDVPALVKIYGDGILLWESPSIFGSTYDSYKFDINVEGVRELKIEMQGIWLDEGLDNVLDFWVPRVCMGDVYIQK